jgi:hypothetical protein
MERLSQENEMFNSKRELVADISTTAATAQVITWTTHEPTASYAVTVADGTAPTSTELGIIVATQNAQITAMLLEIAAIKVAIAT